MGEAPHSTLYTLHSTLHNLHFRLHTLHFTLYTPHSTLYTPHSTLYTLHSTLHTLHYTFHSSLHTFHSSLHTLHTLHFTLHTADWYSNKGNMHKTVQINYCRKVLCVTAYVWAFGFVGCILFQMSLTDWRSDLLQWWGRIKVAGLNGRGWYRLDLRPM